MHISTKHKLRQNRWRYYLHKISHINLWGLQDLDLADEDILQRKNSRSVLLNFFSNYFGDEEECVPIFPFISSWTILGIRSVRTWGRSPWMAGSCALTAFAPWSRARSGRCPRRGQRTRGSGSWSWRGLGESCGRPRSVRRVSNLDGSVSCARERVDGKERSDEAPADVRLCLSVLLLLSFLKKL
jgi:hypothetical protein